MSDQADYKGMMMQLVKKVAAGAAIATMLSMGVVTTADAAPTQAPLELDLTSVDQLIINLQDSIQNLFADLGGVTENLGQQPGLNEALTAVGQLLTGDAVVDLIQALVSPFFQ